MARFSSPSLVFNASITSALLKPSLTRPLITLSEWLDDEFDLDAVFPLLDEVPEINK